MWRRVSCEQPLHTIQSILSPRRKPKRWTSLSVLYTYADVHWAKGNPVPIPEPSRGTVFESCPR